MGQAVEKSISRIGSPGWLRERLIWFVQLRAAWAAWKSMGDAVGRVRDLNEALHDLKAVTQANNEEFEKMETAIREAAVGTKFLASEAATAATELARGGFKPDEVEKMIGPITLLASATNRGLTQVSELMTTVSRAWDIGSEKASHLADVLANAISNSRLQIEDLANMMKYAAKPAAQLNMSIEDSVAWFGALRDVGLEASQVGTAFRRIIGVLSRDVPRFTKVLNRVGLTFKDVSLRNNTLNESMKKMRDAGLSIHDLFEGTQIRAAGVLGSMLSLIGRHDELREKLHEVATAQKMADEQMKAANNIRKQTLSILDEVAANISKSGYALEWFERNIVQAFVQGLSWAILEVAEFVRKAQARFRELWDTTALVFQGIGEVIKNARDFDYVKQVINDYNVRRSC